MIGARASWRCRAGVGLLLTVAANGCRQGSVEVASTGDALPGPSGDDRPGGDREGDGVQPWLTFVPEAAGQPGDLWLELGAVDQAHARFSLRVKGDGLEAYGVAGRLRFDTLLLTQLGIDPKEALAADGVTLLAKSANSASGNLFGISRVGEPHTDAHLAAGAVIAELPFLVTGSGATTIQFEAPRSVVLNSRREYQTVAHWLGGELVVGPR
ncbi:MAG: hypothetical protein HY903_07905 [Deltaproteobacteria bacterium]|nr:hypothetical protein [Deltaproteobacteria bacterium]